MLAPKNDVTTMMGATVKEMARLGIWIGELCSCKSPWETQLLSAIQRPIIQAPTVQRLYTSRFDTASASNQTPCVDLHCDLRARTYQGTKLPDL